MLTQAQFRALAARARLDALPFMASAITISTKQQAGQAPVMKLTLNPPQLKVEAMLRAQREQGMPGRVIVLKARQPGISTYCCAKNLVTKLTQPFAQTITVAHIEDAAEKLFRREKFMVERLPEGIRPKLAIERKNELLFKHIACSDGEVELSSTGSTGYATGKPIWRGMTIHGVHLSEFAFFGLPASDVLLGVMQSVPDSPDSYVVIESTANGMGNPFQEEWARAEDGESGFAPVFIGWWELPDAVAAVPEDFRLESDEKQFVKAYGLSAAQVQWRRNTLYTRCLTRETRIGTEHGIVPIASARRAYYSDEGEITRWMVRDAGPVWRLDTKAGRILRGTADHPVQLADGRFVELGQLEPGMRVRLMAPRFADEDQADSLTFSPGGLLLHSLPWTPIIGRFLGYFMGDGSWGKDNSIEITCTARDTDVVADVAATLREVFGREPRQYPRGAATRVQVAATAYKDILDAIGAIRRDRWGVTRRSVHVVEAIFGSPRSVAREFLSALFESDGMVARWRVSWTTSKEAFARDVQLLLLGFGIPAPLVPWTSKVKKTGKSYPAFRLDLTGEAAVRFHDEIGFRGARKQAGKPRRSITNPKRPGRTPNPIRMEDVVVSVRSDGIEETYDLTVEPNHVFSANGIATHNCQGNLDLFQQEYPGSAAEAFLVTGRPAFPVPVLRKMHERALKVEPRRGVLDMTQTEPRRQFVARQDGELAIWRWPEPDHLYVIGADAAEGTEDGDFSAAAVVDRTTQQMVAMWHGKRSPIPFAHALMDLGTFYAGAMLAPEISGGHGFCLSGNTIIHSPSGDRPIADLVGTQPWVYAWRAGRLQLARARRVWRSGVQQPCVRVRYEWYPAGQRREAEIVCTPEHPFLCRDGGFRRASDLAPGTRLMPFAQMTKQMGKAPWKTTRVLVQTSHGPAIWERRARWVWEQTHAEPLGDRHVHHRDENTTNDDPDNLEALTQAVHTRNHTRAWFARATPDQQQQRSARLWESKRRDYEPERAKRSSGQAAAWARLTPAERAARVETMSRARWGAPDDVENHRVVSVTPAGCHDVYDMEVPGAEMFAANTVFVHNSVIDECKARGYYNLYQWQRTDRVKNTTTNFFGWMTTSYSRPLLFDTMHYALTNGDLMIWCPGTIMEMLAVRYVESRPEGEEHDDRVFALMIAWLVHLQTPMGDGQLPRMVRGEAKRPGPPDGPPLRNVERQVWAEIDQELKRGGAGRAPLSSMGDLVVTDDELAEGSEEPADMEMPPGGWW